MSSKDLLRRLSFLAFALVIVVIALGAYTRLSHAGLGCPDWPGCYGFLTVPSSVDQLTLAQARFPDAPVESSKGWLEMIHRYAAGCALLLVFSMLAVAKRAQAEAGQIPLGHVLAICLVMSLQAAFGMWTVTLKLWPQIVSMHLLFGVITLSLLYWLWLRQVLLPSEFSTSWPAFIGIALVALILLSQIALGGWLAANYSSLACPDFPTCQGQWWPKADFKQGFDFGQQSIGPNYLGGLMSGEGRIAIHLMHRIGALVCAVAIISVAVYMFKRRRMLALRLIILVCLQCLLGVANVVLHVPVLVAVFHNLLAASLLASMVETLYVVWSASKRRGESYVFHFRSQYH
ncbi:Heme A synthase [Marinomonas aquimarina]|uniref:Heme A synthase n=1 Tax=Marinomonas aquimarina TaxID=295068 RepID=A0A1A8TQP8_9GAMM|nr:COX15/CtaA family protein [Marinomonas aquimarina]SBS36304.1 Heme A synthase [Marinomonas aquimarina]